MVLIKPASIPHSGKIDKCAWENYDVRSSVQDFHILHFEIVTFAAASTPKEVIPGVQGQSARRTSNGGCALTW